MSKERPIPSLKPKKDTINNHKEPQLLDETVQRSPDLTLLTQHLGIEQTSLTDVGRSLLSRFAERVKSLLPDQAHETGAAVSSSSAFRLAKACAFVGMQLVAQGADAHTHTRTQSHAHVARHRGESEVRPEARPVGLGFELIGISSSELTALVAESFPPFVFGHQRISLIRFVADDASVESQSIDGFVPPSNTAWPETARHEHFASGGQITLRTEAFREPNSALPEMATNFWGAMGTLVHEIGHSARVRRFFPEQARNADHLEISDYSEGFLNVRQVGQRLDFERMGGEMQCDLLKRVFFHAPLGAQRLEEWSIDSLQQEHPTTPRALIAQNVRELFALAPGFDWDAGIARFRKGTRALYDQFSRTKMEYALLRVPARLRELLPDMSREQVHAPQSLAEQLTFDSRLQQDTALQQHYRQFRASQMDTLHADAARLTIEVPGFAALHTAWEETIEAMMRFQAYRQKNTTLLTESHGETIGSTDQARQAELPTILQSVRGADLASAWFRIPSAEQPLVLQFMQREADLRLHRGSVPPVIAEEARRVLQAYQLSAL